MKIKSAGLQVLVYFVSAALSSASILVHLDFDDGYAPGSLAGQSGAGDVGLSGTFQPGASTATATVVSSGEADLSYQVSGGGVIAGGAHLTKITGAYGVSQDVFHRALSSDIKGRSLFMRVVMRADVPPTDSTFLRFYLSPSAPAAGTVGGQDGAAFGLRNASGSGPGANALMNNAGTNFSANTGPGALVAGATHLLVAKFNWNASLGKYDSVSIWVNPSASSSEVPIATAPVTPFAPGSLAVMGVGVVNFGNGQTISVDSYAVGTEWSDVVPVSPDPALVFKDSFDNGSPADSDAEATAWTLSMPQTSTATEGGGELVQSASAADASTVITSAATAPQTRFNFFLKQLKIGASVRMGPSSATDTTTRRGRLMLASSGPSGVLAPDTFSVMFFVENAVKLDTKVNVPNVDPNTSSSSITPKIVTANAGNAASFPYYNYSHNFHLTVDAKRYRLVSNVNSDGAIRARFTGLHGLNRSDWGANGDSALILEAMRSGAAAATSATASWDSLKVEENSEPLLNEPFWDMAIALTSASGNSANTQFRLWIPSTEPAIRGILFVGPGTGLDFRCFAIDPMVQEAARAIGFGVMAYAADNTSVFTSNLAGTDALARTSLQTILDRAAQVSGHPEIANAPVCFTGFSLGAYDAINMALRWPERTLAYVAQHYGVDAPASPSAAVLKVPGLFVLGSTDWTSSFVKDYFGRWRAKGAQVALSWVWGVDHNVIGNQGWESTWTWLVETVNLRYPRPLAPSTVPGQLPSLLELADSSGWLGDNIVASPSFVANPFLHVAPYASYTGSVSSASWYPNETCARFYRAQTSTDLVSRTQMPIQSSLRMISPKQYGDQVPVGRPVLIGVDPREFDDARAITSMEFYDGSILLGTDSSGPEWGISFVPTASGLHSLSVVATDSAGNRTSAMRALFVAPTDYPPLTQTESLSTAAGAELSGTLFAKDPEGEPLSFSVEQAPAHGLLVLNPTSGEYSYRPVHGYQGSDSFSFQVADGTQTSPATSVSLQVTASADFDGDGLPDAWESAHAVSSPAADEDGDGFSNLDEYFSLTDPHDGADYFRAEAVGEGNIPGTIALQWAARGGVRYRVQYSDDLQGFLDIPRSIEVELQPGGYGEPGSASFTDDYSLTPLPVAGKRFYRVKTNP